MYYFPWRYLQENYVTYHSSKKKICPRRLTSLLTSYLCFSNGPKTYRGVSLRQWKLFVLVLGLAPLADLRKLAAAVSRPFLTFATNRRAGLVTMPLRLGLWLLKWHRKMLPSLFKTLYTAFYLFEMKMKCLIFNCQLLTKMSDVCVESSVAV